MFVQDCIPDVVTGHCNLLRMMAPSPIPMHLDDPEKSFLNHCFQ